VGEEGDGDSSGLWWQRRLTIIKLDWGLSVSGCEGKDGEWRLDDGDDGLGHGWQCPTG